MPDILEVGLVCETCLTPLNEEETADHWWCYDMLHAVDATAADVLAVLCDGCLKQDMEASGMARMIREHFAERERG